MDKKIVRLALICVLILGIILFINSDIFVVDEIIVLSAAIVAQKEYIPQQQIIDKNIFHINLEALVATALKHPQIKDVAIRRSFPSTITYQVTERRPLLALKKEQGYLIVDNEGYIIWELDNPGELIYPTFCLEEIEAALKGNYMEFDGLTEILKLLTILSDDVLAIIKKVEMIEESFLAYLHTGGYVMISRRNVPLELDRILKAFVMDIAEKGLEIEYLDLRFTERPVYKLR